MNRGETGRGGDLDELRPCRPPFLEIGDADGLSAVEAVQARALLALKLEHLQQSSRFRGCCHHVQHTPFVGQEQSCRGDVEELGALGGQSTEQLDHIEVTHQAVGQSHEGFGDAVLAVDVHQILPESDPEVGVSSESSTSRRSMMSQATSLAVWPLV